MNIIVKIVVEIRRDFFSHACQAKLIDNYFGKRRLQSNNNKHWTSGGYSCAGIKIYCAAFIAALAVPTTLKLWNIFNNRQQIFVF